MIDRLKYAMKPFPGAFAEFSSRTEGQNNVRIVVTMRDYISIE